MTIRVSVTNEDSTSPILVEEFIIEEPKGRISIFELNSHDTMDLYVHSNNYFKIKEGVAK